MARKFNLFNFMEKKLEVAEISPITQKILDQLAFKELALFIGVSYIANTLSKCEFKVFEKGVEVKNRLYYMLNISPNPNQNSSQFINKFIEHEKISPLCNFRNTINILSENRKKSRPFAKMTEFSSFPCP